MSINHEGVLEHLRQLPKPQGKAAQRTRTVIMETRVIAHGRHISASRPVPGANPE